MTFFTINVQSDSQLTSHQKPGKQQESRMKYLNHWTMKQTNLESESSKNKSLKSEVETQTS